MTTEDLALSVVEQMMAARAGKMPGTVFTAADDEVEYNYMHLGLAGVGKVGKTHLGLDARTHEIREPVQLSKTFPPVKTQGKILIPEKPMKVAYANFDRPAGTVRNNLQSGAEIYEELFYLDANGEPFHPLELKDADFDRIFMQLDEFVRASIRAGFDLCFIDGGTITWEYVRRWRLPTLKADADGHAPKEYGPANLTMRTWVQRLYSSEIHSIISLEAREKWSKASGPDLNSSGNAVMIPDGWRKTMHYTDMTGQMSISDRRDSKGNLTPTRIIRIDHALKLENEGREFTDLTFRDLYKLNFGQPLILHSDYEEYSALLKQYDKPLAY